MPYAATQEAQLFVDRVDDQFGFEVLLDGAVEAR